MKTSPCGFARRHVWRQFILTFAAIVSLFQSAFALSGRTDQESPPVAPTVNDPHPWKDETKREKAFEIKDWSFGVLNPTTIGSATGGTGAGKAEFAEFSIPKVRDPAAPFFQYQFETIFTTKIDWSGSGDEGPEEDISFGYGRAHAEPTPITRNQNIYNLRGSPTCDDTTIPGGNTNDACMLFGLAPITLPKLQPLFGVPRVNEATGELFVEYLDLVIPGRGLDLVWGRTYRSKIGLDTPMGVNWDFSYNIRAAQSGPNITVQDGQNRIDTYFLQRDGSFSSDELFRRGTLSGKVFTLEFADKTRWIFKPLNGSPTSGKIDRIIDRNSSQIQFQYDGSGRLS